MGTVESKLYQVTIFWDTGNVYQQRKQHDVLYITINNVSYPISAYRNTYTCFMHLPSTFTVDWTCFTQQEYRDFERTKYKCCLPCFPSKPMKDEYESLGADENECTSIKTISISPYATSVHLTFRTMSDGKTSCQVLS